jgi:hypothetical protein
MFKMGLHDPFGHFKHKLWPKEGPRVKMAVWLLTIKSWESPQFPCMQVACKILLESCWWGIQLCFRPHLNQRSTRKVMCPQSCGSPNFGNFGTPTWSPGTKWHLGASPMARHKVYYKGEGGGFPQVWAMVNLVNLCLHVARSCTKVFQLCTNQLVVWFVKVHVSNWVVCQSS